MHAFPHLAAVDWIALAIFFSCWAGYAWFSEHSQRGAAGLIRITQTYRQRWSQRLMEREVRIADSSLIGNLVNSVSFYANTTIYIIAGLIAALGAADQLLGIAADLPFAQPGNRELLEIKLALVLGCFVFAYFKFTWSLRQFNLLSILIGAAPCGRNGEPEIDAYSQRIAGINSLAGDDFNRGIRAYYFGMAAATWLLHPGLLALIALGVTVVLYRRDYRSAALACLHGSA